MKVEYTDPETDKVQVFMQCTGPCNECCICADLSKRCVKLLVVMRVLCCVTAWLVCMCEANIASLLFAQALYCSRQCPSSDTAHSSPGVPECGLPWPLLLPEELWLALRLVASAAGMTAADPQQQQQQQQRQGEQGTQQHPAYQQPQEQAVTMQPCSIEECMEKQRDKAGLRGASNQCYVSLLQSLESHVTDSSREQLMHWVLLACVGADMHATCYKAELLHDHKSAAAHQLELSIKNITAASCVSRRPDDGTVCHVSAEALLQALGQIAANGIAVRPAATAGVDQRLAVAMYPVCSMFNHDCDANCVMRWGHDWLLTRSQSCGL